MSLIDFVAAPRSLMLKMNFVCAVSVRDSLKISINTDFDTIGGTLVTNQLWIKTRLSRIQKKSKLYILLVGLWRRRFCS